MTRRKPKQDKLAWSLTPEELPKLTEAQVVRQICDFLEAHGWMMRRNHVGKFIPSRPVWRLIEAYESKNPVEIAAAKRDIQRSVITIGEEGEFDHTAIHPQYPAFWIEFKRPGGEIRDAQITFYERITKAYRFRAVFADNLDAFIAWYKKTFPATPPMTHQAKPLSLTA